MRSSASSGLVLNVTSSGIDPRLKPALSAIGPGLRQIERETDRQVLGSSGQGQAHAHLAVGDLAGRARVLALHADRMGALFEPPSVVDDPILNRFSLDHRRDGVLGSLASHGMVIPGRVDEEVAQSLRERISLTRITAGTRCDGLNTLSVAVGKQAIGVDGERSPAFLVVEDSADTFEVLRDAALAIGVDVELEVHGHKRSQMIAGTKFIDDRNCK
jgi:hypothetical protein